MDRQEEKVVRSIDIKGMIDYAQRLIRSKSLNPPADYSEVSQIAFEEHSKLGLEVAFFEGRTGKINVFSLLRGSVPNGEVLCLSGHMDVVPAGDEKIWKYPPFGAEIRENKIWGRGAADMKCALAAQLYALAAVKRTAAPLRGSVMIGNTVDDETAGIWGMKYMIEKGLSTKGWPLPTFHVLGEANHLNITGSFKGRLWLHITTGGKSAHGGAPQTGINAIEKMIKLIEEFRKIPKTEHPLMGEDTFNLGILKGGAKVNIVPAECEAHLDFRMCSPADSESSLRQFKEVIQKLEGGDPHFRVSSLEAYERRDPVEVDFNHPLIEKVKLCIRDVVGKVPAMEGSLSAGDLYHCLKAGIPGIWVGPGDMNILHQTDEYLDLKEFIQAAKIYALLILRICG
jgi:succinyl-diaminopimelate desuccinylase